MFVQDKLSSILFEYPCWNIRQKMFLKCCFIILKELVTISTAVVSTVEANILENVLWVVPLCWFDDEEVIKSLVLARPLEYRL